MCPPTSFSDHRISVSRKIYGSPKKTFSTASVIIDRGSELCRPPTSASPRKLTSGPYEKLVAMGQQRKSAASVDTLSARIRNASAIRRSSAFAVLRLIANSNLPGCSTGMSAGFSPCRILIPKDHSACQVAARGRGIWKPLATLLASEKWIILYRPAFGYSAAGSHKKHGRISR